MNDDNPIHAAAKARHAAYLQAERADNNSAILDTCRQAVKAATPPKTDAIDEDRATICTAYGQLPDNPDGAAVLAAEADAIAALKDPLGFLAEPVQPLAKWRDADPPEPVIWRDRRIDTPGSKAEPWPLVSVGEPGILSAPGGSGKSWIALSFALAAASHAASKGDSALGFTVRGGPVILVAYEDGPARMASRLKKLAPGNWDDLHLLPDPGPLWEGDPEKRGAIRPGQSWGALTRACRHLRPSLVIIDPAGEALADVDTAQASAVRTLYRELGRLPGHPGVLIVAHDTKAARNEARSGGDPGAGAVSGSAAWFDRARGVAYLTKTAGGDTRLTVLKANNGPTGWGVDLRPILNGWDDFEGFEEGEFLTPAAMEGVKAAEAEAAEAAKEAAKARIKNRAGAKSGWQGMKE